jgi:hypothetical protein
MIYQQVTLGPYYMPHSATVPCLPQAAVPHSLPAYFPIFQPSDHPFHTDVDVDDIR